MTGTGFVNNPAEMWSLVNFLQPTNFPSYWRFRRQFCEEENWGGYNKIVGIKSHMVDSFIDLRKSLGPRRTMQEVHKDITEPIYTQIDVELNPTQRRMYKEIVTQLMALDQQGVPIHSPNVVSMLQRLRQISVATPELVDSYYDAKEDRRVQVVKLVEPSSKLDAVMDILEELQWDQEARQQVVVFSNFRDPLELLKKRLDPKFDKNGKQTRAGIPYIHMEQKDSEQTRFEKWHELFPLKQHQVFLSTIDLGGESINLTPAQYCIFLDRSWSPAKNLQAVGRIYRPGQTQVAEIIHIKAIQTVDKRVMDLTNLKTSWFRRLFDDVEI
jgi:SNF2 family DNA or RNA helicase